MENRTTMKAMIFKKHWFSSLSKLELQEVATPDIKDDEVLITVCATGINIDDHLLQTEGHTTDRNNVCPGLECSGIIAGVGGSVRRWKIGDRVCAILTGGGYAEQVAVPSSLVLPVPDAVSLEDAATLPYATCSLWVALFQSHEQETLEGKSILIHEGASKFGLMAIQFAKYKGLKVFVTTESYENFAICREHGADMCINYKTEEFDTLVKDQTRRKVSAGIVDVGVDFVLDFGCGNLRKNTRCCEYNGEVVILDFHGLGHHIIDCTWFQAFTLKVKVTSLARQKLDLLPSVVDEVLMHMWPAIMKQRVVPVVCTRFSVKEALTAYEYLLDKSETKQRIVLVNNF